MKKDSLVMDASLVRGLINFQFSEWKDLPIQPVRGWDNRTFHLGKDMSVCLPSAADYENDRIYLESRVMTIMGICLDKLVEVGAIFKKEFNKFDWVVQA